MSSNSSLREVLNGGNPNEVFDAMVRGRLGDMLAYACSKMGFTETGISVTSNVATLANTPKALFQCVVASGTTTGVKKLRKGPVSGTGALVPATGECVWDGGTKVLFAAADVAATASFTYAVAGDIASITEADLINA